MALLVRGPYFGGIVHMPGLVQVIRKVCDSRFSFKRVHGTTTVAVKIKFAFHFRSTVRNVPFHFYKFFRSYLRTIADSAITGFESNQ